MKSWQIMEFFLRGLVNWSIFRCKLNTFENRKVKQSPANYRILIHPAPRLGEMERFCAGTSTDS
jgi:hypothetical protein